jgi:hypothetical protein
MIGRFAIFDQARLRRFFCSNRKLQIKNWLESHRIYLRHHHRSRGRRHSLPRSLHTSERRLHHHQHRSHTRGSKLVESCGRHPAASLRRKHCVLLSPTSIKGGTLDALSCVKLLYQFAATAAKPNSRGRSSAGRAHDWQS